MRRLLAGRPAGSHERRIHRAMRLPMALRRREAGFAIAVRDLNPAQEALAMARQAFALANAQR